MAKNFLIGLLLLPILAVSCLSEGEIKRPFRTFVPEPAADGWEIAAPQDVGMDPEALRAVYEDFHADREAWQVRSLLVARNGKLIAESYTKDPADRDRLHPVWSCTKQVLALLVQRAVEEGLLDGELNRSIAAYLPELLLAYPDKADITLENLLTMTSGIAFSNSGLNGGSNQLLKRIPARSTEFVLGLPVAAAPGERFNYSDGDPQVVSAILQTRLGRPVDEWAAEVLFEPLEIERWEWLRYRDGITMGPWGLSLRPRDLAKFGQVVANGGTWAGHRIVAAEAVERLTRVQVEASAVGYHGLAFGYYWWIDPDRGVLLMNGQGGQFVCVHPQKALVVAVTAEPNTQGEHQFPVESMLALFDRIDRCVL